MHYIQIIILILSKCTCICTFAPKGKGGYHHVNTQDEVIDETFEKFNFNFQLEETKVIRASSTINKNFIRNHCYLKIIFK